MRPTLLSTSSWPSWRSRLPPILLSVAGVLVLLLLLSSPLLGWPATTTQPTPRQQSTAASPPSSPSTELMAAATLALTVAAKMLADARSERARRGDETRAQGVLELRRQVRDQRNDVLEEHMLAMVAEIKELGDELTAIKREVRQVHGHTSHLEVAHRTQATDADLALVGRRVKRIMVEGLKMQDVE